jgi:hypothetical protein
VCGSLVVRPLKTSSFPSDAIFLAHRTDSFYT